MTPKELKCNVSYKFLLVCVSTVEREAGPFQVSKRELVLHETLNKLFPRVLYFVEMTINE